MSSTSLDNGVTRNWHIGFAVASGLCAIVAGLVTFAVIITVLFTDKYNLFTGEGTVDPLIWGFTFLMAGLSVVFALLGYAALRGAVASPEQEEPPDDQVEQVVDQVSQWVKGISIVYKAIEMVGAVRLRDALQNAASRSAQDLEHVLSNAIDHIERLHDLAQQDESLQSVKDEVTHIRTISGQLAQEPTKQVISEALDASKRIKPQLPANSPAERDLSLVIQSLQVAVNAESARQKLTDAANALPED